PSPTGIDLKGKASLSGPVVCTAPPFGKEDLGRTTLAWIISGSSATSGADLGANDEAGSNLEVSHTNSVIFCVPALPGNPPDIDRVLHPISIVPSP
uniref:Uncharacterized protein n=1 Tax=Caenorhabditis japonica TaxID=281687 RepID=A0A8R1IAY7_CAEJA